MIFAACRREIQFWVQYNQRHGLEISAYSIAIDVRPYSWARIA